MTDELRRQRASTYFEAVGRVVVIWAEVELELFDAFRLVTRLSDKQAATIFGRLGTVSPRIELLVRLMKDEETSAGYSPAVEALASLKSKVELRNMLVHQPAFWSPGTVTVQLVPDGDDQRVEVFDQDPGHLRATASPAHQIAGRVFPVEFAGVDTITSHHDEVADLRDRLVAALRDVRQRR